MKFLRLFTVIFSFVLGFLWTIFQAWFSLATAVYKGSPELLNLIVSFPLILATKLSRLIPPVELYYFYSLVITLIISTICILSFTILVNFLIKKDLKKSP